MYEYFLLNACRYGPWQEVERILKKGGNVRWTGSDGTTVLHYAAYGNQTEIVQRLLTDARYKTQIDIHSNPKSAGTALHVACMRGHLAMVNVLIENGADVTLRDRRVFNHTPLHVACYHNYPSIVQRLLTCPAIDVNALTLHGETALLLAVINQSKESISVLLQHSADVNQQDYHGKNALSVAIKDCPMSIVNRILARNPQVNLRAGDGETLLHLACKVNLYEIAKELVHRGASVNATFIGGVTPLHIAVVTKNANIIKLLLESGASISAIVDTSDGQLTGESRDRLCIVLKAFTDLEAQMPLIIYCLDQVCRITKDEQVIKMWTDYLTPRMKAAGIHQCVYSQLAEEFLKGVTWLFGKD